MLKLDLFTLAKKKNPTPFLSSAPSNYNVSLRKTRNLLGWFNLVNTFLFNMFNLMG